MNALLNTHRIGATVTVCIALTVSTGLTGAADATGGTALAGGRTVVGDLDITKPGTVISGVDVHGFIQVRADNVVIRGSVVRGRPVSDGVPRGLIKSTSGARNLLIENTLITDDHPSVHTTAGILGQNFTARHVQVRGAVDSVQIHGGTAIVEDSYLHDPIWYASDPRQGGRPSHNDGIQILGGHDIVLRNNTVSGASNFAVLAAPQKSRVTNLRVSGNHLANGYCAIRLSPYGGKGLSARVTGNVVQPNQTSPRRCGINVVKGTAVAEQANRYTDGQAVVPVVTGR